MHAGEVQLRAGAGAGVLETGAEGVDRAGPPVGVHRRDPPAGALRRLRAGDLGREQRLFTRARAVALSARHETCAAEGCDRPFAWCELHHLKPWSAGGPTDLDNAIPLCGFHHRRIHDHHYTVARAPDGALRYIHRWPSRQHRQALAA